MKLLTAFLLGAAGLSAATGTSLRAGAYAADITPERWPVRLIGNFERLLADKTHDPLHARALVLDDGRTAIAIVVVDSCYVPRALFDRAKKRAAQATGIPESHMLMAATHTHTAPPSTADAASAEETAYRELLETRIAQAVVEAQSRRQPAQIGWLVRREPEPLHNRRWRVKPESMPLNPFGEAGDKVRMNPPRDGNLIKPAGPTDPGFTVVSVKTAAGKPLAVLANYSLHYVGDVPPQSVSADYFGEFARQIAMRLRAEGAGPDFVGILSNGTSGDVNNINFDRAEPPLPVFGRIQKVAGKLAESAYGAYRESKYNLSARIAMEQRELPLRYRKPTAEQLAKARQVIAEPDEKKLPARAKAYAKFAIALHEGPDVADVMVQAVRIGDLGIAAIPCEVFTETGLEIKSRSPMAGTFTMELANGHYGYLPTPEQHELGGYETWLGTNKLEIQASRKITATLLDMLRDIKRD